MSREINSSLVQRRAYIHTYVHTNRKINLAMSARNSPIPFMRNITSAKYLSNCIEITHRHTLPVSKGTRDRPCRGCRLTLFALRTENLPRLNNKRDDPTIGTISADSPAGAFGRSCNEVRRHLPCGRNVVPINALLSVRAKVQGLSARES